MIRRILQINLAFERFWLKRYEAKHMLELIVFEGLNSSSERSPDPDSLIMVAI